MDRTMVILEIFQRHARSRAALASRRSPCGLDGLAQRAMASTIAACASRSSGVVAAWSR